MATYVPLIVGSLLMTRLIYTHKLTYFFLAWNLILAYIPFMISELILSYKNKFLVIVASLVWLIFFPNAAYILSDIIHIRQLKGVPVWFDALLVFTCAYFGVMFAFASLRNMEFVWLQTILKDWLATKTDAFSKNFRQVILSLIFLSTGFGIYIGRFLRFNSWDVITRSSSLFDNISERLVNPFQHVNTWCFTIAYAAILFCLYAQWSSAKYKSY